MKPILVLIIEEDPIIQETYRKFIGKMKDFKVVGVANNAVEALMMVKELQPQLVILDTLMSKTDGLMVLKEIRRKAENIDMIIISADTSANTIHEAIRLGVIDYIIKPFKFERLREAMSYYKSMNEMFSVMEDIEQEDLDNLLWVKNDSKMEELPKGLNQVTLNSIINYLQEKQTWHTSTGLAKAVGIARVTARRYLEYLSEKNEVTVELEYGSIGRPVHKYKYMK